MLLLKTPHIYSIHTYYNYFKNLLKLLTKAISFINNIWYTRLNSNDNTLTIRTQLFSVAGTITTLKLKNRGFFGNEDNSLVKYITH